MIQSKHPTIVSPQLVRIDFDACRNEEEKNAAIRAELAKLPPHRRPHSILLVPKRMSASEWDEKYGPK